MSSANRTGFYMAVKIRWLSSGGVVAVLLVVGLVLSNPSAARAGAACEYLEGQPPGPACLAERAEEEEFFKRLERERQEEREREAAEEKAEREQERKEEKERKARERQEHREAQEWAVKPRITQKIAHDHALALLHKKVPTWTYRTAGNLQCGGGKVSRSDWRCRVSWIAGSVCHAGRIRVIGAGHRNHVAIIDSKIEYRNGYGFVRHGRIRCLLEREG
jgi:hypothetical protein